MGCNAFIIIRPFYSFGLHLRVIMFAIRRVQLHSAPDKHRPGSGISNSAAFLEARAKVTGNSAATFREQSGTGGQRPD